ncbi:MAG: ribonuclease D [Anaerolineales bacterium]|nr:ribonuclease D [Anaerolineales bacterium]
MSSPYPPPEIIADEAGLERLARALEPVSAFSVDTESNSLHAYRERVCLIQVSTPEQDFIIDPFPLGSDIGPLRAAFADPARQKVFHAAEYDILCLKRDFEIELTNLFDTMVAARTLGWPQTGLASLLESRFNIKLDKRFQRADWGHRPLSEAELDYARMDTRCLLDLRDLMIGELNAVDRLAEAEEEFARLTRLTPEPPRVDYDAFWRLPGARELSGHQAAILSALFQYRERQAMQIDLPPFKVIGNETLVQVAQRAPRDQSELRGIPGMTAGQIRRHGAALVDAVRRGSEAQPVRPPRPIPEPDDIRERYERLRNWRKQKAGSRGVESDVIIPREALWELARRVPRTPEDLAQLDHLGPWRRAAYGQELLEILRK